MRIARLTAVAALLALGAPALRAETAARGDFALERLAVPQVTLIDQYAREQPFRGPLTEGRLLVINFNYTTCESICPIGNDVMAQLDALLPSEAPVRLMSITIDPGRDTPAHMRKAADSFGASDRWAWLTGNPAEVTRLLAAFDADAANIALHDPVFLVGDLGSQRFYRSQSMPAAEELAALVRALAP
ncbi:MAG: SCO family protein [Pseudodonghicola sp.]